MSQWLTLCSVGQILPGCGVCALAGDQQIALFRPYADEQIFALSNIDPFAQASVLSRGIIAEHQGELWVASPLKKQHFRLKDGLCMEDEAHSISAYEVRVRDGNIELNTASLQAQTC
ncbi:nitrite reductase small subunit NirD [Rahnella woolbedingensis]|uniref:Nitrite reductase (NADH) small subunit n=1 Tax=Rahnella woolbedingensis TaxID=1510574 RepID=A0A419N5U0_9GAMM|nr:nitrite reductase small subunit NirD [Rahnella woolbedingensis]RJT42162.1 nitrite reductase small subunit NirD [Rahnella woolbedingensis]